MTTQVPGDPTPLTDREKAILGAAQTLVDAVRQHEIDRADLAAKSAAQAAATGTEAASHNALTNAADALETLAEGTKSDAGVFAAPLPV